MARRCEERCDCLPDYGQPSDEPAVEQRSGLRICQRKERDRRGDKMSAANDAGGALNQKYATGPTKKTTMRPSAIHGSMSASGLEEMMPPTALV